jgi:hypothetical protein
VPHPSESDEVPAGWWYEEHQRGSKEILIIHKGAEPKGSVEVDNYEEKVAWTNAIKTISDILR